MDSLKRPHNGDGETGVAMKKRAISSTPGSPPRQNHVNGSSRAAQDADEPRDEDDLERFRKVAIFRQMRRRSRECERLKKRVELADARKKDSDEWLVFMETCWTRILKTLTNVIGVDDWTDNSIFTEAHSIPSLLTKIFTESQSMSSRAKSAKEMEISTIAVIKALLERSGVAKSGDQVVNRLQRVEDERSELQIQVRKLEHLNADLVGQSKELTRDLADADLRAEKLEKEINVLRRDPTAASTGHSPPDVVAATVDTVKREDAGLKLDPPLSLDHPNGQIPEPSQSAKLEHSESDESTVHLAEAIAHRDELISKLEDESARLRDDLVMLKSERELFWENSISEAPSYKLLFQQAQELKERIETLGNELKNYQMDLLNLKKTIHDSEAEVKEASEKEAVEVKALLKKRDEDLTRVKQERFNLENKSQEQKSRLESANTSLKEYKVLCDSQEERIKVLCSEVQRLRTRLAQQGGSDILLNFIFRDTDINLNYVHELEKRINETEEQLDNARRVDVQAVRAGKLDLVKELGEAKKKLAEIEEKYGADIDLAGLRKQLDVKDSKLRSASERESQLQQQLDDLMTEVDRLSVSWETLNEQVQQPEKSFKCWEEERDKLVAQKAKTDNLYFKIKKELELRESESKQANRHLEKQYKAIEVLTKSEKCLQLLNGSLESQLEEFKYNWRQMFNRHAELERECVELRLRNKTGLEITERIRREGTGRETTIQGLNRDVLNLKEKLSKAGKDLDRAKASANVQGISAGANASEREEALQKENSKYSDILKCSTCRNEFRSRVITKCMHTFCKSCVDARIQHRSRKCPACNLAFSQGDVQQIFFQ